MFSISADEFGFNILCDFVSGRTEKECIVETSDCVNAGRGEREGSDDKRVERGSTETEAAMFR